MNAAMPPVLLTSCIYVADHSVQLKEPTDRIKHTVESIEEWLRIAPDAHLVICDSSGFDFTQLVHEKFPQAAIECLHFVADRNLVQFHGKGYGEGEIIKFAVQNSMFIKQADYFAKCTAKLWVENFHQCLKEWNGVFLCKATFSNVFSFRKTCFDHVDTRFYLVSKDFYWKHLSTAHLNLGHATGLSIEDNFRDVVLGQHLNKVIFCKPPVIAGVGGATGKYYNQRVSKRLKETLRSRLVQLNKSFKHLFNCN
jgi:hypothetical protein